MSQGNRKTSRFNSAVESMASVDERYDVSGIQTDEGKAIRTQNHHVISLGNYEARQNDLFKTLDDILGYKFDPNDGGNGIPLPVDEIAQDALADKGIYASVHRGNGVGHRVTDQVINQELSEIALDLSNNLDGVTDPAARAAVAREALEEVLSVQQAAKDR